MRRLFTIAILCSTLVALLGCTAGAKIVEKENIRSIPILLRYIERAEGDGSPGQVFVLIRLGAASILVDSAMDSSVDPLRHAELLHTAMQEMGFERMRVVWTTEGGYSIASCKVGSGRLFAREAETAHRIGALLEIFREAGFTPVAEAGVLRYAESDLHPERETERYGWAALGNVPADYEITVQGRIADAGFAAASALLVLPYVIFAAEFFIAIRSARNERLTKKTRRRLLRNWTVFPVLGVFFATMAGNFTLLQSPYAIQIADIWLGRTDFASLMLLLSLPSVLILVLLILPLIEWKLIGPVDSPLDISPELQAKLNKQARVGLITLIAVPFIVAAAQGFLDDFSPLRIIGIIATVALALCAHYVMSLMTTRAAGKPTSVEPTDDLYVRAERLARNMGVPFKCLEIDDSTEGQVFVRSSRGAKGELQISRKAVEVMTPGELDFLMATELAVVKPPRTLLLIIFLFGVPIVAIMVWRIELILSTAFILFAVAGIILGALYSARFLTSMQENKEAASLHVTGSLAAAESAMLKMMKYSEGGERGLQDHAVTDPEIAARLEALRTKSRER